MASDETPGKKKGTSALEAKVVPDAALGAVVGTEPLTRGELTKRIWAYIKEHGLQDAANKRNINADDKLRPIFDGKSQVTMFEMTKLVNGHVTK
jgi:chromatin remodeling complex protein RSC6